MVPRRRAGRAYGTGEGGRAVVNGDQPDRLPSVVRAFANLEFLLPGPASEEAPSGLWLAKWQNDGSAEIYRGIERFDRTPALIGEIEEIGFCDFG